MYYGKAVDGKFLGRVNVADEAPGVHFPSAPTPEELAPYNIVIVYDPISVPEYDPTTQTLSEIYPILGEDGRWYANYEVVTLPPSPPPPGVPT